MLIQAERTLRDLWSLEPGRTFLNHGSYGACPVSVLDYQTELRARLERGPSDFFARLFPDLLEQARADVAAFLGARPGHLAFLGNATAGVNAVLRSLEWHPGDEVLLTDHTYNACANVVTHLAATRGVAVTKVAIPFPEVDEARVVSAVMQAVTPRTRLALLDHVTSPTALILPVIKLAQGLSSRGIKVLIDGAHAPGMLDLELESLGENGVTYYTGNLHKWCCSPKGAGFLWVAEAQQRDLRPTVISHGFNSSKNRARFLEEFDWEGTFDPTPWLAAPRAIQLLGNLFDGGWPELRSVCHDLLLEGRSVVADVLPPQAFAPESMLGQIAALEIPTHDQDELYRILYDEHGIDAMITTWNGRTLLRLSAAAYNTRTDYHHLAAALRSLTP